MITKEVIKNNKKNIIVLKNKIINNMENNDSYIEELIRIYKNIGLNFYECSIICTKKEIINLSPVKFKVELEKELKKINSNFLINYGKLINAEAKSIKEILDQLCYIDNDELLELIEELEEKSNEIENNLKE
ncbi:MAG: hypothetical protein LBT51_03605 [Fusobacteriaceae bacterium]|nr:hypothetical protein [Fusobacteriaceae bacterium]